MREQFLFDEEEPFLHKLKELVDRNVPRANIATYTPFHVHQVEEILREPPSKLRFFTLVGAIAGMIVGFALTILTVRSWPLITGGKPLISIPPFIIIAYELTILFGSICTLIGFLILSKLPSRRGVETGGEFGNKFAIIVDSEENR